MPEEENQSLIVDDQTVHDSAEVFDAMRAVRPNRPRTTRGEAVEKPSHESGPQFDFKAVEALVDDSRTAGKSNGGNRTKEAG
jgi:response regulator RpfG family c-di-GMP phosphodiesterase